MRNGTRIKALKTTLGQCELQVLMMRILVAIAPNIAPIEDHITSP